MIPKEYFQLHPGGSGCIPSRGLGTFQPDPQSYPNGSVKQSVLTALRAGCRHIDTSLRYDNGQCEREVGEAVRESGIPREDIFIVTKLYNVFHAPEDVEVGMDMSLANLGFDCVPYAYKKTENFGTARREGGRPVIDIELSRSYDLTWAAMEKLVDKNKAKYIGISNFSSPKVKRLLQSAKIKPAVNQIECHPHWPQKGLVKLCQENNIHVTAFGPLGCAPIPALRGRIGPGPLEDETVSVIAKKYSKTPAQVILCYLLCRGISVIPKSNDPTRIVQNFDCIFEIDEKDFHSIDNIMGENGERGIRNLESLAYVGFDNYNEELEEP
ncbi:uncharacterized protein TRIVIDRAFT_160860 [Trichoderma virens Gv29-8]|uniref:NADP-dependent oxidoreductase domain-containing protein n=1 Tax=Hypocrea virens (strain Gv29-8 / FGSC 10586) TaxID=413071 RepID=G9N6C3_HYPVG|nr:uncharacterized protein TRIVIDRAFT_160860 [Trichoderma virens Gv29-8]EHK17685.1 hypothetical protein TRIVIDRAFT_160860 [Trichoderma virens Gv29-8]UKZ53601.1 hypothetical protein TrVGV298_007396 [Trichoderma virens]